MDVAPFLDPVPGQEMALTQLDKLVARETAALLFEKVPKVEKGDEV
jgi:hypothetical protein